LREEPGAIEALRALSNLSGGEVVVETERASRGMSRPGTVAVLEKTPERLVLDVTSPDPSWLFVLRGFWSYRTIRVNGRPARAVPAQLAFTAVPLEAGTHRIEWIEEVPGLAVSRWGPVLFILIAAALLLRPAARVSAA
jgi:hypothetical protein